MTVDLVQLIKCLSLKPEELCPDLQHPYKKLGYHVITLGSGQRQADRQDLLILQLLQIAELRFH